MSFVGTFGFWVLRDTGRERFAGVRIYESQRDALPALNRSNRSSERHSSFGLSSSSPNIFRRTARCCNFYQRRAEGIEFALQRAGDGLGQRGVRKNVIQIEKGQDHHGTRSQKGFLHRGLKVPGVDLPSPATTARMTNAPSKAASLRLRRIQRREWTHGRARLAAIGRSSSQFWRSFARLAADG